MDAERLTSAGSLLVIGSVPALVWVRDGIADGKA